MNALPPDPTAPADPTDAIDAIDPLDLIDRHPELRTLQARQPLLWANPRQAPAARALADVGLGPQDVAAASARFRRFAPLIAELFPATAAAGGLIESPLREVPRLQAAMARRLGRAALPGRLWMKLDSHLPVSGSIKARGGIHEVLQHAEALALAAGLLRLDDDYRRLLAPDARALLGRHRLAVGSTGNLGLSIGLMGAALAMMTDAGRSAMLNPGPHGFSEVLYAVSSAANNNGSAFAGLSANSPFWNCLLAFCMFVGRFGVIIPVMAIAGSLVSKKSQPASSGTLPTHGPLFVGLLIGTVLLVGALTFIPALALGPVAEYLS